MEALPYSGRPVHSQKVAGLIKKEVTDEDTDDDEDNKKKRCGGESGGEKKGCSGGGSASSTKCCQAEKCSADMNDAKPYHKRHRVCEYHAKTPVVNVAGIRQRFCQQCSRFHELSEFDEAKRSCRRRLAGHNERRRKSSSSYDHHQSHAEQGSGGGDTVGRKASSGGRPKEEVCGQQVVDGQGRIKITMQDNTTFKHFQIR